MAEQRGGQGNVHKETEGNKESEGHKEGLMDKMKDRVGLGQKKEGEK